MRNTKEYWDWNNSQDDLLILIEKSKNKSKAIIMNKKELIEKIEWIIEGADVGDNVFKIVQDINKLIKEQKQ